MLLWSNSKMWELKFRAERYKFSSCQMNKQESYLHLCKLNSLCQLLYIVTLNEYSEYNVLVFKTEIHEANSSEPLWNFLLLHFKIDKVDVIETTVTELSEIINVWTKYHRLLLTFDIQFVENVTEAFKTDVNGNVYCIKFVTGKQVTVTQIIHTLTVVMLHSWCIRSKSSVCGFWMLSYFHNIYKTSELFHFISDTGLF